MKQLKRFKTLLLYLYRAVRPIPRPPLHNRTAVCTKCGWIGKYTEAKHLSDIQLYAKGILNEQGKLVDKDLLHIKRCNGGWIDYVWCPKHDCNHFINTYYEPT